MSSTPWYRWFAADYRRKTTHLSFAEDAAYRRLIDAYMDRQGPLPADPISLYRLCSAQDDAERAAVDSVSAQFFTNGDGRLKHARCELELRNQKAQADQRHKSAEHAARMRWAMRTQCGKMPDSDSDSDSDSNTRRKSTDLSALAARTGDVAIAERKKATRLQADWRIPDAWLEWAQTVHGIDRQRGVRISLVFRDFWVAKAGQNGAKMDWAATWRNWVRKEVGDNA